MVNTAIITNTASYPGTGSCNKVDADEFSGCIVGSCIVGDCIVGVDSGTSCGVVDTGYSLVPVLMMLMFESA